MAERDELNVIYGLFCACHPDVGVRYVGLSSRGAEKRFAQHVKTARHHYETSPVYAWMRKHGIDNIRWRVLDAVESADDLAAREIFWIAKLGTYRGKIGLNMTIGGEGAKGLVLSEEARQRMSVAARARGMAHLHSPEILARRRGEGNPNASLTDDDVAAIKQMLWEGESVAQIADLVGSTVSTISKISTDRSWTHVPWPIGPRREMRTSELKAGASRGRKASPETVARLSESQKAAWTEERRLKESARVSGENNPMYGKLWTAEQKAAASLARSPLDVEDVREIRRLRQEESLQYAEIAAIIGKGVGVVTIGGIIRGKKFAHVQ